MVENKKGVLQDKKNQDSVLQDKKNHKGVLQEVLGLSREASGTRIPDGGFRAQEALLQGGHLDGVLHDRMEKELEVLVSKYTFSICLRVAPWLVER